MHHTAKDWLDVGDIEVSLSNIRYDGAVTVVYRLHRDVLLPSCFPALAVVNKQRRQTAIVQGRCSHAQSLEPALHSEARDHAFPRTARNKQ